MIIIEPVAITDAVLTASNVAESETPWAGNVAYTIGDQRMLASTHALYEAVRDSSAATVTISVAAPGVVGWTGHGLADGAPIVLTTTGALPTGVTAGTTYYVKSPTDNAFNLAATVGGAAITTSGTQSGVHTATARSNYNRSPATNPAFWVEVSATNRYKMFDAQNNTQTEKADLIDVTITPAGICTGVYVGNLEADTVLVTMTDPVEGVVYSGTRELVVSNSGSSFWNWCFKRIMKKTTVYFDDLPPYIGAAIRIQIAKTGGTAKCGMCAVGAVTDIGLTERSVSTDIIDYSTTTFNPDGTSETIERNFAKRMTADVLVDNAVKDSIEAQLAGYRQTPVVWIASALYEVTTVYGKYQSLKTVIDSYPKSRMSLQIQGMV